ncbi:MAG: arylesterase [Cohaesibacteraceae bacterium]|nr:arylesterase [Cohaesibacteraceae bacterium]
MRSILIVSLFFLFQTFPASATSIYKLVVFGDSLVAGYGLAESEAFPSRLGDAIRDKYPHVEVINAGVSGDTSAAGLARLEWSIAEDTNGVILELGANDALRGLAPGVTFNNLDQILQKLKQRNIDILIAGMLAPPNFGPEYTKEYLEVFQRLALKYNLVLYPFFLDGVTGVKGMTLNDRLHPNAQGVDIIVTGILPLVEQLLTRKQQN